MGKEVPVYCAVLKGSCPKNFTGQCGNAEGNYQVCREAKAYLRNRAELVVQIQRGKFGPIKKFGNSGANVLFTHGREIAEDYIRELSIKKGQIFADGMSIDDCPASFPTLIYNALRYGISAISIPLTKNQEFTGFNN